MQLKPPPLLLLSRFVLSEVMPKSAVETHSGIFLHPANTSRSARDFSLAQKEDSWHTGRLERTAEARHELLSSSEGLGPVRATLGWHRFMRGQSPGIEEERG